VTRADALRLVRESIARGSATPALGGADRGEYLRARSDELEAALVEPIPVSIQGEAFHHGLVELLARHQARVIARRDDHYLGFVEGTGDFFLAYGPDTEHLNALGFFSNDALAEWLG